MPGWDAIPRETPIDDRSGLLLKNVRSRSALNVAEAQNIATALLKYLGARPNRRTAPFHLDWCLRLHREMLGKVWNWAGEIRRVELNLGVPAFRIELDLQQLMDDLADWRASASMNADEQSARLHHRAVQIHPFLNGNGRWARLLANVHLKQIRAPLTLWPEQTLGEASVIRDGYLKAIRAADTGDYDALIELHRRHAEKR